MSSDLVESFRTEMLELADALEASLLAIEAADAPVSQERVGDAFRAAHNIKAAAAMIGISAAVEAAHAMESVLDEIRDGGAFDRGTITGLLESVDTLRTLARHGEASEDAAVSLDALSADEAPGARAAGLETLLVGVRRVDALVDLAAEMCVAAGRLEQLRAEIVPASDARMETACREVKRLASRIQEAAMAIRLVPLRATFEALRRFVRDQALFLGKSVIVEISGAQTELDKSVAERLLDPLQHLVRNALDHGIEAPEDRAQAGKPSAGRLSLSAIQQQGEVVVIVEDDGRGIDPARVREAALREGMIAEDDALTAARALELVFAPGLSTAERVGELSGRGVGLDVVRRNLLDLGGAVRVESEPGRGVRFSLSVPLTLAVIEGLVIRCGEERLVVPIDRVKTILRPAPGQIVRLPDDREILVLSGLSAPLFRPAHLFEAGNPRGGRVTVVIVVDAPAGPIAIGVDDVISQEAVMLKPLQRILRFGREGVLGAAVLGDGGVALVLDVARLAAFGRPAPAPRLLLPTNQLASG